MKKVMIYIMIIAFLDSRGATDIAVTSKALKDVSGSLISSSAPQQTSGSGFQPSVKTLNEWQNKTFAEWVQDYDNYKNSPPFVTGLGFTKDVAANSFVDLWRSNKYQQARQAIAEKKSFFENLLLAKKYSKTPTSSERKQGVLKLIELILYTDPSTIEKLLPWMQENLELSDVDKELYDFLIKVYEKLYGLLVAQLGNLNTKGFKEDFDKTCMYPVFLTPIVAKARFINTQKSSTPEGAKAGEFLKKFDELQAKILGLIKKHQKALTTVFAQGTVVEEYENIFQKDFSSDRLYCRMDELGEKGKSGGKYIPVGRDIKKLASIVFEPLTTQLTNSQQFLRIFTTANTINSIVHYFTDSKACKTCLANDFRGETEEGKKYTSGDLYPQRSPQVIFKFLQDNMNKYKNTYVYQHLKRAYEGLKIIDAWNKEVIEKNRGVENNISVEFVDGAPEQISVEKWHQENFGGEK